MKSVVTRGYPMDTDLAECVARYCITLIEDTQPWQKHCVLNNLIQKPTDSFDAVELLLQAAVRSYEIYAHNKYSPSVLTDGPATVIALILHHFEEVMPLYGL